MYTATVLLKINNFVPMTGIYADQSQSIDAAIAPPVDTSPEPANVFSGDGQSITVTVPPTYQGAVQITYQLPDNNYVLLGLAFKGPIPNSVGRLEFRSMAIQRDPSGSQLTVTDACLPGVHSFNYVILVQQASTANIGLIDPDIETEGSEP